MSGAVLLGGGIAALLGALLLAALVFAGGGVRAAVQQGISAIETAYAQVAPDVATGEARQLSPLLARLGSVAVRLSPGNPRATLRRRLDIAGNPTPWTPDRVLAFKGAGLVALPIGIGGFLFLTRPAYMRPLVSEPMGLVMLAIAGVLVGLGSLWLSRLIKVEV